MGTRFLCLLRMFLSLMPLSPTTELCPVLPNFRKRKTLQSSKKITTLSKPYSILTDTFHLPSVSTSAISFAVALTIRMPVSLIPSRSASSCRRCVFFSGGVSKRNWSFCHNYSPYYILLFTFPFGYVYTVLLVSQNRAY